MPLDLSAPPPKSLGECIDYYHDVRDLRIAMGKEVDAVKQYETKLKSHILQQLSDESGISGASGKFYRAQRVESRVPSVKDWKKVFAWVKKTGRFDILQKRLLNSAITDMWDADEDIPGVEPAIKVDLSVTKVK